MDLMSRSQLRLSEILQLLAEDCRTQNLTVAQLFTQLGISSHALVVFIFSVPFLQPIPVPGLSILLGFVIAFSGLAITIGKPIWLPKTISNKMLKGDLFSKILIEASRILNKIEFLFKPGFSILTENAIFRWIAGLIIITSGVILLLPLPPGTNFPPALVCVLISVGILERDGILLLLGIIVFVVKLFLIFYLYRYFSN